MICKDAKCVFHKDKIGCYIPENKNFFVKNEKGEVIACLNRIYTVTDLSMEGKNRLKQYKKGRS